MPLILAVRNSSAMAGEAPAPLRIDRGEVVIGRGAGAGLLLSSPAVSRRHCTISGDGAQWRLADTSSGGTFVNGQRLSAPHLLRHGDVIRTGDVEIAVMLEAPAISPAAAAPAGRTWPAASAAWTAPGTGQDAAAVLLQAAGLSRQQIGASEQQVLACAGAVLRAALAGLVRLAQDRRQARRDLGVAGSETTALAAAGSPEELLLRLLAAPPAEAAAQVNALCSDLDAHQRAVLGALQDSLHRALDQFSPRAIKTRARSDGEAWKVYERAFEAQDGFVEVFAQAMARRYAEAVGEDGSAGRPL